MKITQDLLMYPFRDEEWIKKTAIYGLVMFLSLLIIPAPLLGGYGLRLMRGIIHTGDLRLPVWDDLGDMYVDGLKQMVLSILYLLPAYLLICCAMIPMYAGPLASAFGAEDAPVLAMGGVFLSFGVGMALIGLASLFTLILQVILYVAIARLADTGDLSAALKVGEVWGLLKTNAGKYLMAFIVFYAVSAGLSVVLQFLMFTVVLICLLPFIIVILSYYLQALMGALFGLTYREALGNLDAAPTGPEADQPLPGLTGE